MRKRKPVISDHDMNFIIFESEMHRLLDLLKTPPGNYVGKRLRDYVEAQGIDTGVYGKRKPTLNPEADR